MRAEQAAGSAKTNRRRMCSSTIVDMVQIAPGPARAERARGAAARDPVLPLHEVGARRPRIAGVVYHRHLAFTPKLFQWRQRRVHAGLVVQRDGIATGNSDGWPLPVVDIVANRDDRVQPVVTSAQLNDDKHAASIGGSQRWRVGVSPIAWAVCPPTMKGTAEAANPIWTKKSRRVHRR